MNKAFKKILIIRLSAIGDVVNVLPALRPLRLQYPDAYISWLVEEGARDILMDNPDLDEIILFPRRKWLAGISNPLTILPTISEAIVFFKALRNKGFDLVIDFQGNLKSGLMTLFTGRCVKLGFDRIACKEWNHLFTNQHACTVGKRIHRIDKNLGLLKAIDIDAEYMMPQIPISCADEKYISDFLRQNVSPEKPLIAIHPGTSKFGRYKQWPGLNYSLLADMLIERLDVSVIFTWGPSELDMVKGITSAMRHQAIISCKTTSLKQLAEIIRNSGLFISGDTGPMHIASVIGRPIIAIFGPKDPVIYGPYIPSASLSGPSFANRADRCNAQPGRYGGVQGGKQYSGNPYEANYFNSNVRIVRKDLPCSPCVKRRCKDSICINSISPEEVFQAARELLLNCNYTEYGRGITSSPFDLRT